MEDNKPALAKPQLNKVEPVCNLQMNEVCRVPAADAGLMFTFWINSIEFEKGSLW